MMKKKKPKNIDPILSQNGGRPIDPTKDARDTMGDNTGLTGITTDDNGYNEGSGDLTQTPQEQIQSMSKSRYAASKSLLSEKDTNSKKKKFNRGIPEDTMRKATGNDTLNTATPPSVAGEQSVSGDNPDPESDDDVSQNAADMGIGLDADDEHPKELDIASDVDKSEEEQKYS